MGAYLGRRQAPSASNIQRTAPSASNIQRTATMSTTAAAAAAAASGESSLPSWILLNKYARVEENHNETTADCIGRKGERIRASLVRERPPLPSSLYVYCSDATFGEVPYMLSMVDDLILFHVYIGPGFGVSSPLKSDFFIYRAGPKRPTLKLLPHPQGQVSRDDPFGIFPRGEDDYTIAALIPNAFKPDLFSLHLFDSKTQSWSRKKLSVESPQEKFPVEIPINFRLILSHNTSTVITLGGSIGWVDLWRGIVFCDMLSEEHTLRGVPLPLPIKCTKPGVDSLGDGRSQRGIAFVDGCLRLVELGNFEIDVDFPYVYDEETGWPCSRTENWTISTWTNKEMSDSYGDWHMDCILQASDIVLGDHSESELPPIDLCNLFVSDPAIGMNENDSHLIYLTARMKFMHPKSWVLAIDMRDRKVLSVVRSGPIPREMRFIDAGYCNCSISK